MKIILALVATTILISGCITGERISEVHPGMSQPQVEGILGEADRVKFAGDYVALSYLNRLISGWSWNRTDYHVILRNYKVVEIRQGTVGAGGASVAAASFTQPAAVSTAAATQSVPVSAAVAATTPEEGQFSGLELRQFLSGNTVSGRTERYVDFHVYFSPHGKMSGKAKMTRYDSGTWQVDDNGTYCRQWDRWQSAAQWCFKAFRVGGNRIRFRAIRSSAEATYTVRFGDPENLKGRI